MSRLWATMMCQACPQIVSHWVLPKQVGWILILSLSAVLQPKRTLLIQLKELFKVTFTGWMRIFCLSHIGLLEQNPIHLGGLNNRNFSQFWDWKCQMKVWAWSGSGDIPLLVLQTASFLAVSSHGRGKETEIERKGGEKRGLCSLLSIQGL